MFIIHATRNRGTNLKVGECEISEKSKRSILTGYLSIIVITGMLLVQAGCKNHWSTEQRNALRQKCTGTETFENIVVIFSGFEDREFDAVTIKEYNNTTLLDTFQVKVLLSGSPGDGENKQRMVTINRPLNIKYRYLFIIPGQKPYELANMKMDMHPQYTMGSEGWGCEMRDFTIDGVRFEKTGNPSFVKREKKK